MVSGRRFGGVGWSVREESEMEVSLMESSCEMESSLPIDLDVVRRPDGVSIFGESREGEESRVLVSGRESGKQSRELEECDSTAEESDEEPRLCSSPEAVSGSDFRS